jgi:hypothetical protein
MIRYTDLPDLKDKPFGGAYSVHDNETINARNESIIKFVEQSNCINEDRIRKDFLHTYKDWTFSTHPKIKGTTAFNKLCFTNGTTESFSHFFIRFRNKRLRLKKGEYFYSQMMRKLWYSEKFAWLDEDDIKEGDVLLISVPFSDTGSIPNELEKILTSCDEKLVPVMLDFAYLNLAVNFKLDVTHPCIEYIVTSLSKVFPVEHNRIGIRMQKEIFEDQLYVINEDNCNYINLLGAHIGTTLMRKFEADYIYKKYKNKQFEMCKKYNLEISPCVYFGIDHLDQYPLYNRGTKTNRLCFTRIWDGRMEDSIALV